MDENIDALWVWLNSGKSNDLRTMYSTQAQSRKVWESRNKYLLDWWVTAVVTLQEIRLNI